CDRGRLPSPFRPGAAPGRAERGPAMPDPSRPRAADPSRGRTRDHFLAAWLALHVAEVVRLESEIRLMRAEEDARIAVFFEAWGRAGRSPARAAGRLARLLRRMERDAVA